MKYFGSEFFLRYIFDDIVGVHFWNTTSFCNIHENCVILLSF